ncbi:hypothetical protein [Wolbachia endosymbiont (group A) of Brachyopa scutellaris]|uniref:hypothetical protein n=1 Tax=Wolbachia endosymbiont (group A) of Brachyopa scutellaris TaxID=3066140 RepID=UPI0031334A6C
MTCSDYYEKCYNCAFSITLTTLALYQSSLWLFEACSCKPAPRGPPSSTAQLQHFPCFYDALSSQCLTLGSRKKNGVIPVS